MKHLAGDHSLGRSFWVHTIFLGWSLNACAQWGLMWLGEHHPLRYVSLGVVLFQPLSLLVWVWSIAGTWMSAMKNIFDGGSKLWSVGAVLFTGSAAIVLIVQVQALVPYLEEHVDVAMGNEPGGPYTVAVDPQGRVIDFDGGVSEGAAAALEKAVAATPKATTVRLSSPGGWVREGRRMADVVRRYGLNTHVDKECDSACTTVFLAGKVRTAGPKGRVGFHRARSIGLTSRDASRRHVRAEAKEYLDAGLSEAFVEQIIATPSHGMWYPTRREMLAGGVLTR